MRTSFTKNKNGFTLLETLVAVAIMTVAIGAAFTMAQKSLMSSYSAKNQTIGYFLAAEGIELVRVVRDNIALYNTINGTSIYWIQPLLATCGDTYGCDIDATSPNLHIDPSTETIADPGAIVSCSPSTIGCPLKFKSLGAGSMYMSRPDPSLPPSFFTRSIHINEVDVYGDDTKKEATITSTVTWLNSQSVSVTETITNWR